LDRCYPRLCPDWMGQLARRYVAWGERQVKAELVELRLHALQGWQSPGRTPPDLEILPLSQCGNEWLLRRVFNETARGCPELRPARVVDILAFASSPLHDRDGIFLARHGSRYVGTCTGRCRPGGTGIIYSLCVHPQYRRLGIGRALLYRALEYLRDRGAGEARIYTERKNDPALRLYHGEGFEMVGSLSPAA